MFLDPQDRNEAISKITKVMEDLGYRHVSSYEERMLMRLRFKKGQETITITIDEDTP